MNEENPQAAAPMSVAQAGKNLLKSVQTPLIWFGLGIIATMFYQSRSKKS